MKRIETQVALKLSEVDVGCSRGGFMATINDSEIRDALEAVRMRRAHSVTLVIEYEEKKDD